MGPVRLVATANLRHHLRSSAVLAALAGLAVAVVLAALAGARRTQNAIPAFVAADRGSDGYAAFTVPEFGGSASRDLSAEAELIAARPGVVRTHRLMLSAVELSGADIPGGTAVVQTWMGIGPDGLDGLSTFHVVRGRMADQLVAGEVMIDEESARDLGLRVGSRLAMTAYTWDQLFSIGRDPPAGAGVDATVVGIVRRPTDLRDPQSPQLVSNDYVTHGDVYATPAFFASAGGDVAGFNPMVSFDVAPGTDLPALLAGLQNEYQVYAVDHSRFLELDGTYVGVVRSASLHARGLQLLAATIMLAALFLVGQTLGRQVSLEGRDGPALLALGMSRRQQWLASVMRMAPVAVVGAVAGVLGAVALSPLVPLPGTVARRAELDTGIEIDPLVLVVGGLAAAVAITLAGTVPAWRAARARGGSASNRPPLVARLGLQSVSPVRAVGIRFALEPGRRAGFVPVRAAIATAAVAIGVVIATDSFSASLRATRDQPERYGVTWDVAAGNMTDPGEASSLAEQLRAMDGIEAFSALGYTAFDTPYGEVSTAMIRAEKGVVTPLIVEGTPPGPGEVALGANTLRVNDLRIGDAFSIIDPIAGDAGFRISGQVVLNLAGIDPSFAPGDGALFDWSVLERLGPERAALIAPQIFLVRTEPGRVAEVEARLAELFPTSTRSEPIESLDLRNLGDASLLPTALGFVVAVLGLGTLLHAMLSAVRQRQRDLAMLKVLGFTRSQTSGAVVWQGLTFGVVALVIGAPLGIIAGRLSWSIAARHLGIPSYPEVRVSTVLVVTVATLVLAVLAAVLPAMRGSRVPAATTLRRD